MRLEVWIMIDASLTHALVYDTHLSNLVVRFFVIFISRCQVKSSSSALSVIHLRLKICLISGYILNSGQINIILSEYDMI